MSATPQFRYPRPDRPDEPIVWVNWHVSSHTEMDAGSMSPLDPAWWDAATETERETALEILRRQAAEHASEMSGRPIEVGEVSYTIHRTGAGPVRPDEEPGARVTMDNSAATYTPTQPLHPHYPDE